MSRCYYYDTEFIEDGRTIELISIGIVREDGATYSATTSDAPWDRIHQHDWLMANVVPHLPPSHEWKTREVIRDEVYAFLTSNGDAPDLWAWYAAYDHVVLSQLWGRMIDLPAPMPMYTNDLRALVSWTGTKRLPVQPGAAHDALADARWVKQAHEWIMEAHL